MDLGILPEPHYMDIPYGLVASQLGDVPNLVVQPDGSLISIADYVRTALGFEHYYIGWCVLISFGWCFLLELSVPYLCSISISKPGR